MDRNTFSAGASVCSSAFTRSLSAGRKERPPEGGTTNSLLRLEQAALAVIRLAGPPSRYTNGTHTSSHAPDDLQAKRPSGPRAAVSRTRAVTGVLRRPKKETDP